ncbi:MAG: hypothetical protein K9J16_18820, partial [Melioribacteraceae bacterium]|nr:hypothetical protein [Melioribacteraceae bacterium]
MKNIIIMMVLLSAGIFSQEITFYKYFPEMGSSAAGQSSVQLSNEDYLISNYGYDENSEMKLVIGRVDKFGNYVWHSFIDSTFRSFIKGKNISSIDDENNFVISTKMIGSNYDTELIKFTAGGDIVWRKSFGTDTTLELGIEIINTADGNLLLLSKKTVSGATTNVYAELIKVNLEGEIIWSNDYELIQSYTYGYRVFEYIDESIYLYAGKNLIRVDKNGSQLLTAQMTDYAYSSAVSESGKIFIGALNAIIEIDTSGSIINTNALTGYVYHMISDNDDIYFTRQVGGQLTFNRMDQNGELTTLSDLKGTQNNLINTADGGFLLSGNYYTNSFSSLSKLTSDGELFSLEFEYDYSGYTFYDGVIYEISWRSINVENMKIEYSQNGGIDWQTIEETYPADSLTYNWFVPYGETDEGMLKISKADNNFVYDATGIFSVSDSNHLQLIYPQAGQTYYTNQFIEINWLSFGFENVNIYFSGNNMNSWDTVAMNYPASNHWYSQFMPPYSSYQCYIKIENSADPEFYTVNEAPFFVTEYSLAIPSYEYIAANEIFMWIGNNGDGSHDPRTDGSGFYWPGGEDATIPAIFEDGLLYGGKVDGQIRVNGNTHRQGLSPGIILPNGEPAEPNDSLYKVYKICEDWESLPPGELRDKYEFNHNNWPGQFGAPYIDVDGDGEFTQGIDEPDYIGDEVLFYAANDLDSSVTAFTYGSLPMGLEFHTTVWGFDNDDFLKDVVFKKYQLINKSDTEITDMYLSYWTDDDLGDAGDDVVGCDTLLDLGFTYNGDENDNGFYDSPPPAVGHLLLQSPIKEAEPEDSAYYEEKWIHGYKNCPLTGYIFYIGGASFYRDPQQGVYDGTLEIYNYMQGLIWNGDSYIDPNTNDTTRFVLAGDPVEETGWYEGDGWYGGPAPSDRRYMLTTGKFNMAPGDTQEVVYALH